MPKGLYEICGPLGDHVGDVVIDESLADREQISRKLSAKAQESLPITKRQRLDRHRVYQGKVAFQFGHGVPLAVYVIQLHDEDGDVHTFTAERLRDAG